MRWAAAAVLGTHDFESFCRANSDVNHHRCMVGAACWQEVGTLLTFTIRADRFLHGMVRSLVGTMVDVGRGYTSLEEFLKILETKDRRVAGMAAPAKGLTLEKVIY
jgi:tRNA pseudouridine38-40 synthase